MTTEALRVLVVTQTHSVGGCDRFLADLARHLDPQRVELQFLGNHHPEIDRYLASRVPAFPGRHELDLRDMRAPWLGKVALRVGLSRRARGDAPPTSGRVPGAKRGLGSELLAGTEVMVAAAQRAAQALHNVRVLATAISRLSPHVVHANNGGYPGAEAVRIAPLAARRARVPSVQFVHNMAMPLRSPVVLERTLDQRVDQATHRWVTAAHRASDALAATRSIPGHRIETVHYGVPAAAEVAPPADVREELGFTAGAVGLLVVAALEPRKGHGILLDALHQITAQRRSALRVALVGIGPELEGVRARAAGLGLEKQVRFLGWRDDVDLLMAACDVLVLPSLSHECLPYAVLEAMSHAKPVVATDVAGIPEMVVDGTTGRVVAPGDASMLADALVELASDSQLRARWGKAGLDRVRGAFDVEAMATRMEALWRDAARSSAAPPQTRTTRR